MRRLETLDFWSELIRLKDELSLRELSGRFDVTPGAISAALKRTGTTRQPAPPGPRSGRRRGAAEPLPPEPGDDSTSRSRPGSKDHLLQPHWELLGRVPDADIAERAGVSVRTVASFRARHQIVGYAGPRRTSKATRRRPSKIDDHAHLLGKVPDRVVAQEAGVSLNAVRNYRNKRGIAAVGRRDHADSEVVIPAQNMAWRVATVDDGHRKDGVVLAVDLDSAIVHARGQGGSVVLVELIGPLF